jgi:hypothetical protein
MGLPDPSLTSYDVIFIPLSLKFAIDRFLLDSNVAVVGIGVVDIAGSKLSNVLGGSKC